MDCNQFNSIVKNYVARNVSQESCEDVEAHLCVCSQCRQFLNQYMLKDESEQIFPPSPKYSVNPENQGEERKSNFEYIILAIASLVLVIMFFVFLSN